MSAVKKSRPPAGGKARSTAASRSGRKATARSASAKKQPKGAKPASPSRRASGKSKATRAAAKSPARKPAVRAKEPAPKVTARPARSTKRPAPKTSARTTTRHAVTGTKAKKRQMPKREVERSIVRIRDLDPYRKCGPGTSVERLIRVDEMVDRQLQAHLVFFDRHGWYCEHGQSCHAVGHARKHAAHAEPPAW